MIIQNLFGSDRSQDFLRDLPNITLKGFLKKLLIFLLLLVVSVGIIFLIFFLIIPGFITKLAKSETTYLFIFSIAFSSTMIFLIFRIFPISLQLLKQQYTSLPFKSVLKHLFIILILGFMFFYLENVIYFMNNRNATNETIKLLNSNGNKNFSFLDFLLLGFVWIIVGFAEEILFRATFFRLIRKFSPKLLAIIISSLLFAFIHHSSALLGWINIFIIGVAYSWYYEYKNNLITVTLLHFLHNALIAGLSTYLAALTAQRFF